jgi:hypothetical protein
MTTACHWTAKAAEKQAEACWLADFAIFAYRLKAVANKCRLKPAYDQSGT